jgi:hypothetical protein
MEVGGMSDMQFAVTCGFLYKIVKDTKTLFDNGETEKAIESLKELLELLKIPSNGCAPY